MDQCGTQGSDYQYVSSSPGIDVLSYHDYWGTAPIGGDQWNGMAVRLHQSVAVGKPIIAGESGLNFGTAPGCASDSTRNSDFLAKEQAQSQAGSSGLLIWNWVPSLSNSCSYDVAPTDPVLQPGGAIDKADSPRGPQLDHRIGSFLNLLWVNQKFISSKEMRKWLMSDTHKWPHRVDILLRWPRYEGM